MRVTLWSRRTTQKVSVSAVVSEPPLISTFFKSTEDLEGLKVSHDFEDLAEGENRILTLKDSRILDNEGAVESPRFAASLTLPCFGRG